MTVVDFIKNCNFDNPVILEVGESLDLKEIFAGKCRIYKFELDSLLLSFDRIDILCVDKFDEKTIISGEKLLQKTEYLYIKNYLDIENLDRLIKVLSSEWKIKIDNGTEILLENSTCHKNWICFN